MKTLFAFALAAATTIALPAAAEMQTSNGKHLLRGSKVVPNLTVRTGKKVQHVVWLESGYGFNAADNCKMAVLVDQYGNITPMGDTVCGEVMHAGLIKQAVPAGIRAYGDIESARILGNAQKKAAKTIAQGAVDAAAATKPDQITVTSTATGGAATADGGQAYASSVSHGGNQYQVQGQTQYQEQQQKQDLKAITTAINNNRVDMRQALVAGIKVGNRVYNVVPTGGTGSSGCNAGGGNGSEGSPDCDPGNSGNTPGGNND